MFTVSNIGQAAIKHGVYVCKLFRTSALFFCIFSHLRAKSVQNTILKHFKVCFLVSGYSPFCMHNGAKCTRYGVMCLRKRVKYMHIGNLTMRFTRNSMEVVTVCILVKKLCRRNSKK